MILHVHLKAKKINNIHLLFQSNSSSAIQHVHIWGTYVNNISQSQQSIKILVFENVERA